MLGFAAVIIALGFVLVKFLATVHMRRLKQQHLRTRADLQKITQRLTSVEGSLQVERATQASNKRKIVAAARFKESMHQRLLVELPDRLQDCLSLCIDHNPVPESTGTRLFDELNLGDMIAESLNDLSVAVFAFPTDAAAANAIVKGEFIQAVEKADVSYSAGSSGNRDTAGTGRPAGLDFVICAFDSPAAALDMLCQFIESLNDERVTQVRGALISGLSGSGDDDREGLIGRYARALDQCQELAGAAPPLRFSSMR